MTDEWSQYAVPVAPAQDEWSQYAEKPATPSQPTGKGFYDALGANMTPQMKQDHPILAGVQQTAQDVATLGEKAANGLTLGALDYGLGKAGIQPPNFDNTAPENKSALNLMGDVANLGAANKTIGVVGSKVVAPVAKKVVQGVSKAVPEALKQSSYALMQSIVNQLPKEFKYGANAGRAMVKEGFQGDAAAIKEQADKRIEEIGSQGDALASASNKPVDNSNAIKIIDDKIAELQKSSPRTSSATITKLQNAKDDLLQVREGEVLDPGTGEKVKMSSQDIAPENMTAKETLDLKRNFDDMTAWKGTTADDTVYNKTMQQARTQLKNNLNDAAPGMKEWNERYADLRAAQQAAGRTATRDQAGVGMSNMINNFVRGSIGMSTFGAMITGHGELAGEILAGGIGKEIITNPYLKSKLAQGLYGLSEADKMAIFKAAPWVRNIIQNINKKPFYEPVDAELVRPEKPTVPGIGMDKKLGLPNQYAPRSGPNPEVPMGGLPNPNTTAIRQPGYVPKGLPEPFQGRSGVDRPWENKGLPTPNKAGRAPIAQGTSYKAPEKPIVNTNASTDFGKQIQSQMRRADDVPLHPASDARAIKSSMYNQEYTPVEQRIMDSKPKTDFGRQIQAQIKAKYEVPLHPASEGRAAVSKVYPPVTEANPNIPLAHVDDFNNMRDWESYQQDGGMNVSGGTGNGPERSVVKGITSGHSKTIQEIGGWKKASTIMEKAAKGEKMTTGEKVALKRMLADYQKNMKARIEGKGDLPLFKNLDTEYKD